MPIPCKPCVPFLLLTVCLAACAGAPPVPPRPLGVAPLFTGVDSGGRVVSLSDHAGRVVVIDFWATWCHPCKASMPDMHALAARYDGDPRVEFLAIHTDESGDPSAYFATNGYTMRLIPRGKEIAASYEVYTLPTYLVIDAAGMVVFRHESQLTREVTARMAGVINAARGGAE